MILTVPTANPSNPIKTDASVKARINLISFISEETWA